MPGLDRFALLVASSFLVGSLAAGCAATTDGDSVDGDEAAQTSAKDVSKDYVGVYHTPESGVAGAISELILKTDGTYALTTSAVENGKYKVLVDSAGAHLSLTPSAGSARNYHVTLGTGRRPLLTIKRFSTSQVLEREATTCDAVSCAAGQTCAVGTDKGAPLAACKAIEPTWKAPLAGHDVWGATIQSAIPYGSGRKPLYCTVHVSTSHVFCNTMWVGDSAQGEQVDASVAPDGSFSASVGTAGSGGGDIRGHLGTDGTIVVDAFSVRACFQTSSSWCEGQQTDKPGSAALTPICQVPGQSWDNGDWVAGYWTQCSQCNGKCISQ